MKRGTVIAFAALILVLIAFFITRSRDAVQAPYVVKPVPDLVRIELARPDQVLVSLERSESGWKMTSPLVSLLDKGVSDELNLVFAADIRTDDLKVSKDRLAAYELTDAKRTQVELYSQGADKPAKTFFVGKEMELSPNVRRSFMTTSAGKVYRAQRSLEFLRQPVDSMRSKVILENDRSAISQIEFSQEGRVIQLIKADEEWQMVQPVPAMRLEKAKVDDAISLISSLSATGFADAAVRFDAPQMSVQAKVADLDIVLELARSGDDWYARKAGDSVIYRIGATAGLALAPDLNALRDRVPLPMGLESIQTVEFQGSEKIIVTKNGESWTMLRPSKKQANLSVIGPIISSLAPLRVASYEDISMEEAGLDVTKDRIILRSKGFKEELLLGARVDAANDRYGKWASLPLIFIIPGDVAVRLLPTTKDLLDL